MRPAVVWICLAICLIPAGCGKEDRFDDIGTRRVTLPDGAAILAEVKADRKSQATGMMYRSSLPADHGMLFVYPTPAREAYWMYNCKIPLDMIWLDREGKVLEVVQSAPPCAGPPAQCPAYGGHEPASFVLELGSGQAKAHGVAAGKQIRL